MTAFLARCGCALGKAGASIKEESGSISKENEDVLRQAIAVAEDKLRKFFENHSIQMSGVSRILPAPVLDAKDAKKNAASKGSADNQLLVIAPISRNSSGKIQIDFQSKIAELGIHEGSTVQMGSGRDIQEGVVQQIALDHVAVLLKPATTNGEATVEKLTASQVKSKQLQLVEKPTAPPKKDKEDPDVRMPAETWTPLCDNLAENAVRHWIALTMYHIYQQSSPDSKLVRRHVESSGVKWSLENKVTPKQIMLVPFADKYDELPNHATRKTKKSDPGSGVFIKYSLKGSEGWNLLRAAPADDADSNPDSAGNRNLFWKMVNNAEYRMTKGPSTLVWDTVSVEVPFKVSAKDAKGTSIQKASKVETLCLTFPVLVNALELPERTELTIPSKSPPALK